MASIDDRRLLRLIHPIGEVFFGNFETLRNVQRDAIEPIFSGRNVLVAASTASGKTEAVMAPLVARVRKNPVAGHQTRILVVTPTRALVNDLYERLEPKLKLLGWNCGCQTSDRRDRDSSPHVLITTPESFDSTMIAGFKHDESRRPVGHLLTAVDAVFLDEGHCYASTVRGDQVCFLLQRLRRLREWAQGKGIIPSAALQVCTASATVPNASEVAARLLGPDSVAVLTQEKRQIQVLSSGSAWTDVQEGTTLETIRATLPRSGSHAALAGLLLHQRKHHRLRKLLVFVQSRAECDLLTSVIKERFGPVVDSWVGAHHSSLSAKERIEAENSFGSRPDAVLVCTSTMEVGVDIGDVDAVCLVGPPPSVASLLQRIGRGNRNTRDLTRMIAIARSDLEARVFSSQIRSAYEGLLRPIRFKRHWSVFVQQAVTFILQAHGQGRRPADICSLADAVWPTGDSNSMAALILKDLERDGWLREQKSRLALGEQLASKIAEKKGEFFANFDASAVGTAVYDVHTGELLANVAGIDPAAHTINIGGRSFKVEDEGAGRIEVSHQRREGERERPTAPRYASRRMPRLEEFCAHLRRGCGLSEADAPMLTSPTESIWFHFGGELWERLLRHLYPPGLVGPIAIEGVAVQCFCTPEDLKRFTPSAEQIRQAILRHSETLVQLVEHGRFFRYLSDERASNAALELLDEPFWAEWISRRNIYALARESSPLGQALVSLLRNV